jgi:hypothetical protein
MNKADGRKLGARVRRDVVRSIEATQARTLVATCDLLEYLFDAEPTALDTWHPLGRKTRQQIQGIEHYLANREQSSEDPSWIERLKDVVKRYYIERVQPRDVRLRDDDSVFLLD